MKNFTPKKTTLRRFGLPTLSLAAAALLGVVPLALQTAPAARAAAAGCVQELPGIDANPGAEGYDNRPNLFVQGRFTVIQSAAEMEGKAVVLGDASVTKASGIYNVGTAGVGSGLWPQPGTDHLVVGGSLSASTGVTVDVGANNTPGGGAVSVGGAIDVSKLATNGGRVTAGDPAAADAYRGLPGRIVSTSRAYATLPATGTVQLTSWGLDLVGDGAAATQVFTLDSAALGSTVRSLEVRNIPAGARVIINVTGGPSVTLGLNALLVNGTPVPISGSAFGDLAGRILWNYTEAKDVHVTGSAQVPGSMLVPASGGITTVDVPGYNGRVYVNGDFVHGGNGSEVHAYPFPDELTGCTVDPTPQPTRTETITTPTPMVPTETDATPAPTESVTDPVSQPSVSTSGPVTGGPVASDPAIGGPVSGAATPSATATGHLAVTGASSALLPMAMSAVGLLLAGALVLLTVRRRGRH